MVLFSAFTGGSAGGFTSRTGGISGLGGDGAAAGATTGAVSAGVAFTGTAAGLTGAPQTSQNLTSGPIAAPHCGQADKASIFAPQDSQNFIPGVTGLPHFWQVWELSVISLHLENLFYNRLVIQIIPPDRYMHCDRQLIPSGLIFLKWEPFSSVIAGIVSW
jgi:hypothetical protein